MARTPGYGRGFGPDDPDRDPAAEAEHASWAEDVFRKAREIDPRWDPNSYNRSDDALHDARRMVDNTAQGKGYRDRDREALLQGARVEDARQARAHRSPAMSGPQFQVDGLDEVNERLHTVTGHDRAVQDPDPVPLTQANWKQTVANAPKGQYGFAERHFSPATRATGHLAGATAILLANMPSFAPKPYTAPIRR